MLNVVAMRLLGEVSWGLKMRVIMGAGLSILDMATDVFVMVGYVEEEETKGYGYSLLLMIVLSMIMQLLIVFGQNKKKPWVMAKEMLIVLTGLKPGYDAAKVCSNQEMEEHHSIDAKSELAFTKGVEMVCESIPGAILQLYVLLKVKDVSRATVGSVIVSAMTTGFSSASISFEYVPKKVYNYQALHSPPVPSYDVDPQKRKESPDFYGYIPDGGSRTVIFGCMMLNSALLLLIRSFSAAMLMLVKKRYFVAYLAGDLALYLLQKVARGDFHYWIPIDGALGLIVSLLLRVFVKTATDFTGVIHFRGPQELGGLYWTVNMFLAMLGSFGSVFVYYAGNGEKEEIADGESEAGFEIEERMAWTLVGSLSGAWVVVFGVFLLLMKKKYLGTFASLKTAKQDTMELFTRGTEDQVRSSVVTDNKLMWRAIREDVKEWVQANWWRWEADRPEWFTESWIAKVPPDMIPSEAKQAVKDIRASAHRKSSFSLVAKGPLAKEAVRRVLPFS